MGLPLLTTEQDHNPTLFTSVFQTSVGNNVGNDF
jgi:hypothetical protein